MNNLKLQSEATARALRSVALPDVCRVEDLATHLGMSPSAVRRALRRGEIPGRHVGRRWLISRPALLEWLSSPREPSAPKPFSRTLSPELARALHGRRTRS